MQYDLTGLWQPDRVLDTGGNEWPHRDRIE